MTKTVRFHLRTLMGQRSDETGQRVTYEDLTKETGISPNTLSRMATGKLTMVSLDVLVRLCAFFDCELHELMRLADAAEAVADQGDD